MVAGDRVTPVAMQASSQLAPKLSTGLPSMRICLSLATVPRQPPPLPLGDVPFHLSRGDAARKGREEMRNTSPATKRRLPPSIPAETVEGGRATPALVIPGRSSTCPSIAQTENMR
jgi:hypothetical protein